MINPAVAIGQLYPFSVVTLKRYSISNSATGITVKNEISSTDVKVKIVPSQNSRYRELGIDMIKKMYEVFSYVKIKTTDGVILNSTPGDIIQWGSRSLEIVKIYDFERQYNFWSAVAVELENE